MQESNWNFCLFLINPARFIIFTSNALQHVVNVELEWHLFLVEGDFLLRGLVCKICLWKDVHKYFYLKEWCGGICTCWNIKVCFLFRDLILAGPLGSASVCLYKTNVFTVILWLSIPWYIRVQTYWGADPFCLSFNAGLLESSINFTKIANVLPEWLGCMHPLPLALCIYTLLC